MSGRAAGIGDVFTLPSFVSDLAAWLRWFDASTLCWLPVCPFFLTRLSLTLCPSTPGGSLCLLAAGTGLGGG